MAFTFPSDTAGKAGAVKATTSGTDFFVPVREQGSEAITGAIQNVTTAGTRVQLPNIPCRKLLIIAKRTNTGYIYVGDGAVSSAVYGAEMGASASLTLEISNANLVYIDASVSGEGVSYIAI